MLARQTVLYGTRIIEKESAVALETRVANLNLFFQIVGVTTSFVFNRSFGSRTTARLMSPYVSRLVVACLNHQCRLGEYRERKDECGAGRICHLHAPTVC